LRVHQLERDIPAQQRRQEKNPRQLRCEIGLQEMTVLFQIKVHKNPFNGVGIQKQTLKDAISADNSTARRVHEWRQKEAVGADHLLPTVG